MKKLIVLALIAVSLVGCGKKKSVSDVCYYCHKEDFIRNMEKLPIIMVGTDFRYDMVEQCYSATGYCYVDMDKKTSAHRECFQKAIVENNLVFCECGNGYIQGKGRGR